MGEKQGEGRDRGINLLLVIVFSKKDKLCLYSSGVTKEKNQASGIFE